MFDREPRRPPFLILYLGADWWGSDARALAVALRQRGHCLVEIQYEDFLPQHWSNLSLRLLRKLIRPLCAWNYNQVVAKHAYNRAIDFLLVFKGMLLRPATLSLFRAHNIPTYCFYPDVSFSAHGSNITQNLALYDCIFTTKRFHLHDQRIRSKVSEMKMVSHGFDPEVHRSISCSRAMAEHYACDISFVGCWSPKKEALIAALLNSSAQIIKLWGPGWNRARPEVRAKWMGRGAYGDELSIIYSTSKINLGLLSEAAFDTIEGDQVTARTWQIPASGAFMLHERTDELSSYFIEDAEVAAFEGVDALRLRVDHYLSHPLDRLRIAEAGQLKCTSAGYTYLPAADAICQYHGMRKSKGVVPAET